MDVIYGLIPAMIFLGLVMVGVLIWAVKSGQYEDFEGDANRILMDDDDPHQPEKKQDKAADEVLQAEKKGANKGWPDAD